MPRLMKCGKKEKNLREFFDDFQVRNEWIWRVLLETLQSEDWGSKEVKQKLSNDLIVKKILDEIGPKSELVYIFKFFINDFF